MLHVIPSHQHRPSDDPIFTLNHEATQRILRGEAVVNATIGVLMDDNGKLAILPTAARAVAEVSPAEWAAYAPISGLPDFLEAVKDDLFRDSPEMRACAVSVATPGGSGALRLAIANCIEPNQSLLTTSYYWGPYKTLSDETDRKLVTFSMFDAHGNFDVGALDRAVGAALAEQKRALLVINDPCHNPTGYSMRLEEWRRVADCLASHAQKGSLTLLVDTAYSAYAAGDSRAFLKELRPLLGKVGLLFAWSASKTFTHYGLRVGAIVACVPDAKERAMMEAALSYSCRGTWSNCSHGGMRAITRLLTEPALVASCNQERAAMKALLSARVAAFNELARARGLDYPRYEGGFFVTVFADDAEKRALRMKDKGVFVVSAKGALRVALCATAERDIPRLVGALAD
ncbi:MAG: aminotransferase class I/II-fold pyridoxal phosphate-dependent enzyme [Polyangiaceae bacterium]|nr:aminotransferase class I/II-fold pyridoxal phosphate-dependent enzyme [Polyangiaceae bacterium]